MIDEVIAHFGSKLELSRALRVSPSAVTYWVRRGGFPARRAIEIELMTHGRFKAVDITKQKAVTHEQ